MNKKYIIYVSGIALVTTAILLIGWRTKAAGLAAEYIDTEEIGDNAGFADETFEKMLRDIGWKGGEAWCMYSAKAVYLGAFPKKADAINRVLTGSTQGSWLAAAKNPDVFKVVTTGAPKKGDIAIWQSTSNPTLGHAGIVYRKDKGSDWYTIEGNSGLGGTREGQGVTKGHRRLIPGTVEGSLKLLGFIRLKA